MYIKCGAQARLRRQTDDASKQEQSLLGMAIDALRGFIEGDGGPFSFFTKIFKWIVSPFKLIVDLIRDPMQIIKLAKQGYQEAKQILGSIFGPKFSKRLTSGIRRCNSKCDCGTYPSTGKGRYHPGVGLTATKSDADKSEVGNDIMSPTGAIVIAADSKKLIITLAPTDSSLEEYEIILENVRPNVVVGDTVQLQSKIGTVGNSDVCGTSAFHLSMRKRADPENGPLPIA